VQKQKEIKSVVTICTGAVLIDFLDHEINASIYKTKITSLLGDSPNNIAVNASRLDLKTVLVAPCGKDGLGDYIIR
jgi:fructokinase